MENKDKIFKVKVLLETDCNACDAADCPVRAKLPDEHASLVAEAADQVAAHLSLPLSLGSELNNYGDICYNINISDQCMWSCK